MNISFTCMSLHAPGLVIHLGQNFWILGYGYLKHYRLLLAVIKCSHFPQPCLYRVLLVFLILAILVSEHFIAFQSVFS